MSILKITRAQIIIPFLRCRKVEKACELLDIASRRKRAQYENTNENTTLHFSRLISKPSPDICGFNPEPI